MTATPQSCGPGGQRRLSRPALAGLICLSAMAVVVVTGLALRWTQPHLSPLEKDLLGHWYTAHGNIETSLELRDDHTVTVSQSIRVKLAPHLVRTLGPTVTSGRWRVEGGQLHLATSSADLRTSSWSKLGIFVRSQRWPAEGELHRAWRLDSLAPTRFGFTDLGTGQRGRAIKSAAVAKLAHLE